MEAQGRVHPSVRAEVLPLIEAPFVFPADILAAIEADPAAWANYQSFTEPYRRIRVAYIDAARKRPAEFEKRLKHFLDATRKGKIITGYGGIDAYYR